MSLLSESFDDECEVEETEAEYVGFLEAREDSSEALGPAEVPLDLVALPVESSVVKRQGFYGVRRDFGGSLQTYELDLSLNLLP